MFKKLLPVIAILLVFVMLAPSYTLAATMDESEILVDMESAHAEEYDELVNISNSSAEANVDTWNPAPTGVWIGSSTKESLFQLGVVTSANSTVHMTWSVRFSANQIMSGVSQFTVRLPLYIDESVTSVALYILAVDVVQSHTLNGAFITYAGDAAQRYVYQRRAIDPTDTSVMDGNDVYVRENRMYVSVTAPIFPDQIYTFSMSAIYAVDANPTMYISPNDVATDGVINSWVGHRIPLGPGVYNDDQHRFDFDWGVSYDMHNGLGNGVTAIQFYFNPGDKLFWAAWAPYVLGINGHHTVTIPFQTDSGSANFSVTVTHRGSSTVVLQTVNTTFDQVILASNATASLRTGTTDNDKMFLVELTSAIGQWVTFYFKTTPLAAYSVGGNNVTRYSQINPVAMPYSFVIDAEQYIGFVPIHSYLACPAQVATPQLGSVPVDPVQPESWSEAMSRDTFVGLYMLIVEVGEFIAESFDIQTPGEAVLVAASLMSGGSGVAWWAISALTDLPSPLDVYRDIRGKVSNLIDAVWDILSAIGSFIWAIGEYIWDALTWLAEQIVEYGAIILGLLIIGVILVIFFAAIYAQLKLWGIVWSLAEGDLKAAANQAQDLASTASSAAGKVKGLI